MVIPIPNFSIIVLELISIGVSFVTSLILKSMFTMIGRGLKILSLIFFSNLWRNESQLSFSNLKMASPLDLPFLDHRDKDLLIREVTRA